MNSTTLWYIARGSGVVALVMLTCVVALGIASRSGRPAFGLPRFAVALVHRNVSLLAVVFLALHVTTLSLDKYAKVDVSDLLVPFVGSYRPFWQGLGTVALLLIAALVATGLLRNRMPERLWRTVHWLAYACWPVAFAHGLGTGTDAGTLWLRLVAAACALTVAVAVSWRLAPHFAEHSKVRRPMTARSRRPTTALGRTR